MQITLTEPHDPRAGDRPAAAEAAQLAVAEAEPQPDINASVTYRTHLAKALVRRALIESGAT